MSRIGRVVLGMAVAVAGLIGPAGAARAATDADTVGCAVDYEPHEFTGGFTADIIITNIGTVPIDGWTFRFPLDSGAQVTSFWNATLASGTDMVVANHLQWNRLVPSANSINLGFEARGAVAEHPSEFYVNDVSCTVLS